jgi:hypothetical protein
MTGQCKPLVVNGLKDSTPEDGGLKRSRFNRPPTSFL